MSSEYKKCLGNLLFSLIILNISAPLALADIGDGAISTIYKANHPDGSGYTFAVACDSKDNVYFIEDSLSGACVVKKIDAVTNEVTTYAGDFTNTAWGSGDGGPATGANLYAAIDLAFDKYDNLYIADSGNCRIRVVEAGAPHIISTYAGNGQYGFSGDGGPAAGASIMGALSLAVDSKNNLYIGDSSNRVRKVDWDTKVITSVVGSASGITWPRESWGDGGDARNAVLSLMVRGLVMDKGDSLFISDFLHNVVRRVDGGAWTIGTFAGNGVWGMLGAENVPATQTPAFYPLGLAVDGRGSVYIALPFSNCIRKVDADTGLISTVAGRPRLFYSAAYSGDGGPARDADLYIPYDLSFDSKGNMYIADTFNQRIRKVASPCQLPEPVITSAEATGPHESGVEWSADAASGCGEVESFAIFRDGAQAAVVKGNVYKYKDGGLADCREYCYEVRAMAGGESKISGKRRVYIPDATPPAIPLNLTAAAVSGSEISLKWDQAYDSCEGAANGYKVYGADGRLVGTTPETSYRITGLSECTGYCYYVTAFDSSGNESAPGPAVSARTPMIINTRGFMSIKSRGSFKQGSAIPVEITLIKNGAPVGPDMVGSPVPKLYLKSGGSLVEVAVQTVGGDGSFKYVGGGVWHINLKSTGMKPGEYFLTALPSPAGNPICENIRFDPAPGCSFTVIGRGK